jgi:hypothetical protein
VHEPAVLYDYIVPKAIIDFTTCSDLVKLAHMHTNIRDLTGLKPLWHANF